MKKLKNVCGKVSAVSAMALMSVPAFADGGLDTTALVSGINSASSIIVEVGTAIFALVGLLVAFRYAKRVAN